VEPVATEPKHKVPWLPLLLGGLAVLLVFAGCLGAVVLVTRLVHHVRETVGRVVQEAAQALQPVTTAMMFQAALSSGDTKSAYQMTTERFREGHTLEDFTQMVKDHPELAAQWDELAALAQSETSLTIRLTAAGAGGKKVPIQLKLRKENDQWKVDDITFP
jgi:hypothetical protein